MRAQNKLEKKLRESEVVGRSHTHLMSSINRDALLVLLQASSKKAADVFLGVAFLDISKRCPQRKLEAARAILPIEPAEFNAAFESAKALIAETLRRGADPSVIEELLGADFHPQLRELLSKIILANAPVWTEVLVQDQVSLPRLIDVNWRVDVVASSSSMSRQARPTVRNSKFSHLDGAPLFDALWQVICEVRLQDPSPKVGGVTGASQANASKRSA